MISLNSNHLLFQNFKKRFNKNAKEEEEEKKKTHTQISIA